ncbi:MAG TPA: ATP-dependent zinc metalloprotease FtsH [Bacteroidales bacterium]|jgi:cell division protease FtsH|nr:ATP-dependent zinc metalloprotease FtsH [Bacteroidales bacterium]MDI9573528.1 ATP-dependent zinc metalloprotease FtsH [Bacteroidota bacterium]OQC59604.1 MAG: ATP-dependent zinc metalloprotease FtsH 3 [Bacteroidetes bacterium ADurb.Bin012]MBP9511973.1 ATP-dependent zinc metalloprotease FtsH [Bacteroidales bacterium]MBP9588576.1 ATP-dependent zinc metalloprotease FtsH [Bacteroidales bacterium]
MNNNNNFSDNNPKGKQTGNVKRKFNYNWIYLLLFAVFFVMWFMNSSDRPKDITWGKLRQLIVEQKVDKIIIVNKENAEIFLKLDSLAAKDKGGKKAQSKGADFIINVGSLETFEKNLMEAQANIPEDQRIYPQYETRKNWGLDLLGYLIPFILLLALWFLLMRMMSKGSGGAGGQIFNIGKSKAQLFDKDTHVNVTFDDVAGLEGAKLEIMEVVDFLKNPKKYTELGGKIPKGVLLVGPPGTGKTLLAKAVAGEARVPFFSLSGSDFVEMFVGVGASRVRDLFKQAKEKAPCIVFIDEIDAVGRARGRSPITGANDERENTLNQLLTEMDGFASNTGVIILAATNRADILDRALLRAGRFDRQIQIELPDLIEREDIFRVHLKPIKIDDTVDAAFLARQTPGFSGADIANVCNEAALIAARKNKKKVDRQDFLDAIDRIIGGLEKRNKIITPEEKRVIAYHEAGHAAVSWLLKYAHPLVKVTIVPRGKALGAAWYLPEERQITTFEQMFDEITATLGGRASEKINFGEISTGALNDLERVTKQAYNMVAYFGLNERLGNISYYDSTGQQEFAFVKPYSEETARIIDEEIKKLVDTAYQRALKILQDNKEKVDKLATRLLEKEVIFREDVEDIFGPRPEGSMDIVIEPEKSVKKERETQPAESPMETKNIEEAPISNRTDIDTNNSSKSSNFKDR